MASNPPAGDGASPFFADARACKAWLAGLAVSNVAQTQSAMLDALRVFNRAPFDALERLKCLELMRDRVAFMIGEERTRQFARPQPPTAQDGAVWVGARNLLEEMEAGYRRCLALAELESHAGLVMQRVVRYLGAQMLIHGVLYRRFDAALWSRLHQQYAAAERAGLAEARVKDSLESEGGASSIMEAYVQAVLLQAANLHEMTPAQVQFAEALLKLWARKVKLLAGPPAENTAAILPIVVDLERAQGPEPVPRNALGPSHRVFDVEGLAKSIRRRVRALQGGEDVATLGLPAASTGVDPLQSLQRLAKRWCEPAVAETAGEPGGGRSAGLIFGLTDIHFFLSGGKAFEEPGKERELTTQEKNDIAVFGRVTERTQSMRATGAPSVTADKWELLEESLAALRVRRGSSGKHTSVGRLVAVRIGDGAGLRLGIVRALYNEDDGLVAAIALFPGDPEPTAVRSGAAPWTQGIGLPPVERLGVRGSLVVSPAVGFRGRQIQVWHGGVQDVKVQEILERGADFDRVAVL